MSKHPVRLKDIAQQLGISIPSVSRALNNKPDIGEATKAKVLALAEKLHYERNEFAINFKTQQTHTIGVIIPQIVHHFFSQVISGIIDEAEKSGYNVMLFQSNELVKNEIKGIEVLKKSMIDGLILSLSDTTKNFDHITQLQEQGMPVVLIDKIAPSINCSKVICDDYTGAFQATEHLISIGKTRVAHITGKTKPETTLQRLYGYKDALKKHNITFKPEYLKKCNLISQEEGFAATTQLLSLTQKPDAIFCATDPTAIGALDAIKKKGLKIPEEIAVIGFSNWKMSSVINPPLSSVSQSDYAMGAKAVALIIDEIDHQSKDLPYAFTTTVMKTALVLRESTVGNKSPLVL